MRASIAWPVRYPLSMHTHRPVLALAFLLALACKGEDAPPASDSGGTDGTSNAQTCAQAAPAALQACVSDYSAAAAACLAADGVLCGQSDPGPAAALDALEDALGEHCADEGLFGLAADATVGRLQRFCAAESDSIAWRSFGGPQAAVWAESPEEASCLEAVHSAQVTVATEGLAALAACGESCPDLAETRSALAEDAAASIGAACGDPSIHLALTASGLAARAALQADCLGAAVLEDTEALGLSCGPSYAQFEAPRGTWTKVDVDPSWGAVCGDGSDYAFWIRPAPEGAPLDRVFVGLQGGGVCVFADDCLPRYEGSPQLFTAQDDDPSNIAAGIASPDPDVSVFAEWTQVYLPYCNQDVFAGGGGVEVFGDLSLPRAGALNLRSALTMTKDFLWRELDAEGTTGYRSDLLVAAIGGWSAGAYGTLYNYHWVLDDLQWPRTVAYPDAGLALDNGEVLGVAGLGAVKIPAWGTIPYLPPYCFEGDCAVGPFLLEALSPRLLQAPEQQVLMISNQRDVVQSSDAYFQYEDVFINQMRTDYCGTKDLPGVHWYLTSDTESVHVVTIREEFWLGEVDGVVMADWLAQAIESPESMESFAEEGEFVAAVAGVEPFPCAVAE